MHLTNVQITNYRCIEDSGAVELDRVTCLVGKNESGKTAFLQALYKLNPVEPGPAYEQTIDYPARLLGKYRHIAEEKPAKVISATFALKPEQADRLESDFGVSFGAEVVVSKGYDGKTYYAFELDEKAAVQRLSERFKFSPKHYSSHPETVEELHSICESVLSRSEPANRLWREINHWRGKSLRLFAIDEFFSRWLPHFLYFDEYSVLPGEVEIYDFIRRRDAGKLDRGELGLQRLIASSGATLEDLLDESDYEKHRREIEAVAAGISDEVFEFWQQNRDLSVSLDLRHGELVGQEGEVASRSTVLTLRIWNNRHRVSVPMTERSRGFVWFFSFLAYFSDLEEKERDLVLLLDEPGLNLHATAQADFLRFIDVRLATKHQVLYTTHSPFLIDPHKLGSVRTVIDDPIQGTLVSSEVMRADYGTSFPLQAAIGFDLAQTLFIGPNSLLVEGPSDLIYLEVLSSLLRERGGSSLNESWVMVPVGGAGKLSAFVSLLGANKLNVAVLMDASVKGAQAVQQLRGSGTLSPNAVITVGSILNRREADIEDLFDPSFYLRLVSLAYPQLSISLPPEDLPLGGERIVPRVEQYLRDSDMGRERFNHYAPAAVLLRDQQRLAPLISEGTLAHAEVLFQKLNAVLRLPGDGPG